MWNFNKLPESEYEKAVKLFLEDRRLELKELLMDTYGVYGGTCLMCYYDNVGGIMKAQMSTGLLSEVPL